MAERFYRKVIRITAEDSPNVRLAQAQIAKGLRPTGEILVPGVLTWDEYQKRLATFDEEEKCVSLWAQWYEGPELKLFPAQWRIRAGELAEGLRGKTRKARAIGVDPGEGSANTVWSIIDDLGLIDQIGFKTPDTDVIPNETLGLMRKYDVPPHRVGFDRGGGGKQIADRLRAMGFAVRTVAFGETLTFDPIRHKRQFREKVENKEERYTYLNRRAQMYWDLALNEDFAIGREFSDLHFQLSKMPKKYDGEGRCYLPPKTNKDPDSKVQTLVSIIGRSPDEADSLVVAHYVMVHEKKPMVAGAF